MYFFNYYYRCMADGASLPVKMDGDGHTEASDKQLEQEKVHFTVGGEEGNDDSLQGVEGDVAEAEATDLFPTEAKPPSRETSSSSSLTSMFVLAEKRRRLR
jgi:hypothetical protein